MQMKRVRIICTIAKYQAIASSLLQNEFFFVRIRLSVYEPGVELARATRNFFKDHIDGLIGDNRARVDLAEQGVIPRRSWWRDPLGLVVLVFVFHNDTQTRVGNPLFGRAQDPYAWLVHFNDRVHPLAGTQ